jgi:hypothetical protein
MIFLTKSLAQRSPDYFCNSFHRGLYQRPQTNLTLKTIIYRFILAIILTAVVAACTKEPDRIGTDVIPPSDRLPFGLDTTIVLEAWSTLEDSVRTDETSQNILGSYWDPYFGITTASIYTQLRLPFTGHSFGSNVVVDSAVLTIALKGAYGDSTSVQTIRIHELLDSINYDSTYYSNQVLAFDAFPLATKSFVAKPYDSVMVDTVKYAPHLRFRLDQSAPSFIQKIITAPTAALSNNTEFLKHLKGLYLTAELPSSSGKGTLMYINLEATLSELVIYYSNSDSSSQSFSLVINGACARFNNFNHHGYTHADPVFRQQVINKDTLLGQQYLYLQAMGGVKTYLRIPELSFLNNTTKAAINEARLIISNADKNGKYSPPDKLILYEEDKSNDIYFLTEQYQGDDYFGGTYNKSTGEYFFRITRYIQDITDGNRHTDRHLTLIASSPSVRGYRLIFNGTQPFEPNRYNQRLRLRVIYTKLP